MRWKGLGYITVTLKTVWSHACMETVSVAETKLHLSELLARIEQARGIDCYYVPWQAGSPAEAEEAGGLIR